MDVPLNLSVTTLGVLYADSLDWDRKYSIQASARLTTVDGMCFSKEVQLHRLGGIESGIHISQTQSPFTAVSLQKEMLKDRGIRLGLSTK